MPIYIIYRSHHLMSTKNSYTSINLRRHWIKHGVGPTRTRRPSLFLGHMWSVPHVNWYEGGGDCVDQNIATYRISICTKKWWWPVSGPPTEISPHALPLGGPGQSSFWSVHPLNKARMPQRQSPSDETEQLDLLEITRHIVKCQRTSAVYWTGS